MNTESDLQRIYKQRFEEKRAYREKVWSVLIRHFFQRYFSKTDVILELGLGYGEFSRLIECGEKYAMDLNPDSRNYAPPGCHFINQDCSQPWPIPSCSLDVIFTSNFFEHLPDKQALGRVLDHAMAHLKQGGILIAMGPNISRVPGRYWDFWDHHLPLTEKALAEALSNRGFRIKECHRCFLPFTMDNTREVPTWMIALYLSLPILWPVFGHQFLIIAQKP